MQPTGRFDPAGQQHFDFGSRRFVLSLNARLEVELVDDAGAAWARLPSIRKADDPDRAPAARAALKAAIQSAPDIRSTTVRRLWRLLACGGVWAAADFEQFVCQHPVLGRVAPALIFGRFVDDECTAAGCLHDGQLCDLSGAPVTCGADARIGLVHPWDLGASDTAAWRARLAELDREPIIPQLERGIYPLDTQGAEELRARFDNTPVPAARLNALIDQGVWFAYDPSEDRFNGVARTLPEEGWGLLKLDIGPLIPRWGRDDESTHTLKALAIQSAGRFDRLHPRVICELLSDVEWLTTGVITQAG